MAQRAFIKKGDLIFVLAFLAFVAGVLWYRQTQPPVEGNWAVVTYDYDELGRLSGKTYGSGVNAVTKTLPSLC